MTGDASALDGRVIVVGAGIAGLATALRLAPRPVVVISKGSLGGDSSTNWAQGGLAAAVGDGDDPEQHAADTIAAGDGLCDGEVVRRFARAAPAAIEQLAAWGARFDRDANGRACARPGGRAWTSPRRSCARRRVGARGHAGPDRRRPTNPVDYGAGGRDGAPSGGRGRKHSRRRRGRRERKRGGVDRRRRAGDGRRRRAL